MLKLKQPYTWMALLIIAVSVIGSCKRNTDLTTPKQETNPTITRKSGGNPPQFTTEKQVDAHLKWIARGLAHWPKPQNLVRQIDSITNIFTNDSTENSITYLEGLYSFGNALHDSLDARFVSNDYDSDGLEGFEYDGEDYITKLYIPSQYYGISKPFVVVAEEIQTDSIPSDTLKGFFAKPGGGIDSVIITDENEDNYYIWVIDFYSLKELDAWWSKQGDSLIRKSGKVEFCDNDNNCEPGEKNNPNCTDCYPLPPAKYRLEITQIEIFRDNCPRAEKFLHGKYEFGVSYGLQDGTGTEIPVLNIGLINDAYFNESIFEIKRKDVCKERCVWGGSRGNNCPSGIHNVDYIIYEEIEPSDTNCKMRFAFFEKDVLKYRGYASKTYKLNPDEYSDEPGPEVYYNSRNAGYFVATISIFDMWQANSHNGSFIWVGNNEAKIKIELIKL